jgi:hypothetical protein
MVALRIFIDSERAGALFTRKNQQDVQAVKGAMRAAADEAADEIVASGRADMASAGNFGSARWQQGLHSMVQAFDNGNVRVDIMHDVPYFRVFQYGAVIHGNPLLWIPLSFASEAQGVRARDFPGRLFRVDRKSGAAPLLLSADDKQPKYFGKESVRIPKKFHIIEIARTVSRKLGALYKASLT